MIRSMLCLGALLLIGGCASVSQLPSSEFDRPAQDVPDHFLVGSYEGSETREPEETDACRSPMVDPRDGTQIRMIRSAGAYADYEVPEGRYGVGPGEMLRLACQTGRPIGVVHP